MFRQIKDNHTNNLCNIFNFIVKLKSIIFFAHYVVLFKIECIYFFTNVLKL